MKIGVVGKSDPQWAAFEEAAADDGHHDRARRLRRLRAAEPGDDRGRTRPQPVPAHRLPRRLQRLGRRGPRADRRDRDLPARPLLDEVRLGRGHPRGRDRRRAERRVEPGPRAARAAVGRPHRAEERRHDLLRPRRHRRVEVQGEGHRARGLAHADVASGRRRRGHQQRLRRGRRPHASRTRSRRTTRATRTRCRT